MSSPNKPTNRQLLAGYEAALERYEREGQTERARVERRLIEQIKADIEKEDSK